MHNSLNVGRSYRSELHLLGLTPWSSHEEFRRQAETFGVNPPPAQHEAIQLLASAYGTHQLPRPDKGRFENTVDWITDGLAVASDWTLDKLRKASVVLVANLYPDRSPLAFLQLPSPVECMVMYQPISRTAELWISAGRKSADCLARLVARTSNTLAPSTSAVNNVKQQLDGVIDNLPTFVKQLGPAVTDRGSLTGKIYIRLVLHFASDSLSSTHWDFQLEDMSLGFSVGGLVAIRQSLSETFSLDANGLVLIDSGLSVNRLRRFLSDSKSQSTAIEPTIVLPSRSLIPYSPSPASPASRRLWDLARPAVITVKSLKISYTGKSPLPATWFLDPVSSGLCWVSLKPITNPVASKT